MRAIITVLCAALFLSGCAKSDDQDTVLGFACGDISSEVSIVAVDGENFEPLEGVKITFYDKYAIVQLRLIEALQSRGSTDLPERPIGRVVATDSDGHADLKCTFGFSDLTMTSGRKKTEIIPDGMIRVERIGYVSLLISSDQLFPNAPYDEMPQSARITLEKEPIQPLQPTTDRSAVSRG
ncbi:hypothetical protein [Actomonas aquatica]|uniref:Lipoprotein n=1 Tax=Actomonas aquatica TaxID=2866162 RepID=A0ABZ1C8X0_9BACT|nr:hypothetical protein [Opitutus sp. WL0086]WRQ87772.1 hypothetical protein K1X11_000010 [Opitutus sp. WL0086]